MNKNQKKERNKETVIKDYRVYTQKSHILQKNI